MKKKENRYPAFHHIRAAFFALFLLLGFGLLSCNNSDTREQEREMMPDEEMVHEEEEMPPGEEMDNEMRGDEEMIDKDKIMHHEEAVRDSMPH